MHAGTPQWCSSAADHSAYQHDTAVPIGIEADRELSDHSLLGDQPSIAAR
jgi:hypothetical protein